MSKIKYGQDLFHRKRLIEHLAFGDYFFLQNDLTIFQVIEKDFAGNKVGVHVLHHSELRRTFSFDEVVFHLQHEELTVIALLIKSYNS
jgi:hypothetical protein